MNNKLVNSIHEDAQHNKWFATHGKGIIKQNPEGKMLTTRISEGMTEYTYKGIVGYGMSEYLDQVVDGKPVGL